MLLIKPHLARAAKLARNDELTRASAGTFPLCTLFKTIFGPTITLRIRAVVLRVPETVHDAYS